MARRAPLDTQEPSEDRRDDGADRLSALPKFHQPALSIDDTDVEASPSPPERKFAAALIAGCVDILRSPRPDTPKAIRAWEGRRAEEIAFIANPKASARWCEAAGLDWDAFVSKLRARKLLTVRAFATAA